MNLDLIQIVLIIILSFSTIIELKFFYFISLHAFYYEFWLFVSYINGAFKIFDITKNTLGNNYTQYKK